MQFLDDSLLSENQQQVIEVASMGLEWDPRRPGDDGRAGPEGG